MHQAPDAISNAIGYAKFFSRSHDAVIRVYDSAGNAVETHEPTARQPRPPTEHEHYQVSATLTRGVVAPETLRE